MSNYGRTQFCLSCNRHKDNCKCGEPTPTPADTTAGDLREAIKHLPDDHPVVFTENSRGYGVFYFRGVRLFTDAAVLYLEKVKSK